jgi:hypothetical protein
MHTIIIALSQGCDAAPSALSTADEGTMTREEATELVISAAINWWSQQRIVAITFALLLAVPAHADDRCGFSPGTRVG